MAKLKLKLATNYSTIFIVTASRLMTILEKVDFVTFTR